MLRARTESSKENRKQFILDCAEQIILQDGLSTLSIANVSKRSKLAVGTIYLYFKSKEDIIAHLTIKSREILLQKFVDHTQNKENALEKIAALLLAFFDFYKENPFYTQLVSFYETNAGLEETDELRQASFKITKLVVDMVKEGKEQQVVHSSINDMAFSFWLWGTTVGILQLIEVKKKVMAEVMQRTELDFYKTHIELVINSLKK